MKTLKFGLFALVLTLWANTAIFAQDEKAQEKQKGITAFKVYHEFDFPVDTLWKVVAEDYGDIINSHPAIWNSFYLQGSRKGELGAKRKLEFNKKGTKALYEKIVAWDPEHHSMQVQLETAEGFPINEEVTLAVLTFKSLGPNKSAFEFDFAYGTKPRFMAGMVKGKFVALLEDYMIALEHYILTGEQVNARIGNFKEVKKQYKARQAASESQQAISSSR